MKIEKISDGLETLIETAVVEFAQRFGRPAEFVAVAPGRVNMIGEHVDYNQGFVLPFAIQRYTVVTGSLAAAGVSTVYSAQQDESFTVETGRPVSPSSTSWHNYVKGVMQGFIERGIELPAMEMLIKSSVPAGSGLSSSAALEVATATFLESATGMTLERSDKAMLCQTAEHRFANVPCGIMDQYVSVFAEKGALLLLDCRDLSLQSIPFDHHQLAVLVVNSNVHHQLASSEYALRRRRCESAAKSLGVESLRDVEFTDLESNRHRLNPLEYLRAKHVVSENERTLEFVDLLTQRNWISAGELLYQSHASLRDDYEVSCAELDQLVEIARKIGPAGGVFGSRMTGGGFGGCTVTLVARDAAEEVKEGIVSQYNDAYARDSKPTASAFLTCPTLGAHVIELEGGRWKVEG